MNKNSTILEVNGKKVKLLEKHKKILPSAVEKQHVFIIGCKGIPAAYGGFETFVEKLTEYQVSDKIHYHVSCIGDTDLSFEYNGAECFIVKVPNIGSAKAIYYDLTALSRCIKYCKKNPLVKRPVFYVLACRIGPFLSKYKKEIKKLGGTLIVNPDGHEWKRAKWSAFVRMYWKFSEMFMIKHADRLICDSVNIENYIKHNYKQFHPHTSFIAYGCDVEPSTLLNSDNQFTNWLKDNGLMPYTYYLIVGRFVPENSFEVMIREFLMTKTDKRLVIITTSNDLFFNQLEKKLGFQKDSRIKFVGTVYNQDLLKKIRENAYGYLHGHTVGGTNPSLLEALGSTNLNLLIDVGFNREVGRDAALYWSNQNGSLAELIEKTNLLNQDIIKNMGNRAKKIVADDYSWDLIVNKYEKLFLGQ